MRWRIGGLLILATFLSCSVAEERVIPALSPRLVAETHEMLSKGRPLLALQEISALERSETLDLPGKELEELKEKSIAGVVALFEDAIQRGDHEDALRYFVSLDNISKSNRLGDWRAKALLFAIADDLRESGDEAIALLVLLRGLRSDDMGADDLHYLLQAARELGNRSAVQIVVRVMTERGLPIPEALTYGEGIPPIAEMISATVTVWVDRGIKLQRGVGLPDRVVGSGFFVDRRGYLLTNYHLVESEVDPEYEGYSRLFVRLSGRADEKVPARVVGYDTVFDLALVKVEVTPEFVFTSAGEPSVTPGDKIYAIGSPAGLERTVSSGIVSAVQRRFLQVGDTIQVDVPLNPGNSGGPLLNERGELIGVVFAGLEQFEGINFAIPYKWVNKVLPYLFKGGEVKHAWLGMAVQEAEGGLEVVYCVPGGPARRAGIRQGDLIIQMNGAPFATIGEIQDAILAYAAPTLVTLTWIRNGRPEHGIVALADRPASPLEVALESDTRDNILYPLFGMQVQHLGGFLWKRNYVITEVLKGSIADEAGLSEHDAIRIQMWRVDRENRIALLQVFVKKKKSGFVESVIQLAAYLETDDFI